MPMAGAAEPFTVTGQAFPKPLIEIEGKPLVEYAIMSARPEGERSFVFVVNSDDVKRFHLDSVLRLLEPTCRIVQAHRPTAGALCTALSAVDELDPSLPLLICNGDQYLECGVTPALNSFARDRLDVGIITFTAVHPRWSFIRVDENDMVVETAEKRPLSSRATVGIYYYRRAELFIGAAERSLLKNARYANQFYICPSINENILAGERVGFFAIDNADFHPLGAPGDVEVFKMQLGREHAEKSL